MPFTVASQAFKLWPLFIKLAPLFNIETRSDLLVATKCLETGIYGAYENVLINLKGLGASDSEDVIRYRQEAESIWQQTQSYAKQVLDLIKSRP